MPDPQPSVAAGIFGRPFREQVAFFRQKLGNLIPTRRWDELDGAAHDRGFTVAGAMKADLLADLAAAVDRTIAEGRGLEEFRRDFMGIVRRRGWTGFTGDRTPAGRAWRTRVVYATNAATSYAAGRMAQLREAGFPIWIYRHSHLSREPRPHHLAWDGSAVPADDPWWRTHYPPNGWGCRCYVVGAANERAARALGAKRVGAPTAPADRTGIDRGWDHAPGATVADEVRTFADKSVAWPYELAKAYMATVPDSRRDALAVAFRRLPSLRDDVRRYVRAVETGRDADRYRTLGLLTTAQRQQVADAVGDDPGLADFALDADAVRHILRQHGDAARESRRGQRPVGADEIAVVPSLLDGAVIEPAGRSRIGRAVVRLLAEREGERWTLVFEHRPRRRMLALSTMWIAGASPGSTS